MKEHLLSQKKTANSANVNQPLFQEKSEGVSYFPPPLNFNSIPVQRKKNKNLPEDLQAKMEYSFGQDFSNVKIQKNSQDAVNLNALAFTQGDSIHFAPGKFNPNSKSGQELLGHELTHVVQQREGKVKSTSQVKGIPMNDDQRLEREANDLGKNASRGKDVTIHNPKLSSANIKPPISQPNNSGPNNYLPIQRKDEVLQAKWTDDLANVATGIGSGIVSVGEDLAGGAYRTARGLNIFNTDELAQIGAENERAYNLIVSFIKNPDLLENVVRFAIENIYNNLPADLQEKIRERFTSGAEQLAGYTFGRLVVGSAIARSIVRRLATRIAVSQGFRAMATRLGVSAGVGATGVGIPITLVMVQGVLERAAQASRRLQTDHPELYRTLLTHNLDMAWFLVEPHYEGIRNELLE